MKFYLFICFVSVMSFQMNSQINKTDSKGLKQGPWEKFYPKSTVLEYKGNFKNNLPIGEFTYFYPSTKVKAVIKHSEEGRSVAYFYHENGEIMTYGIYRNYKKDSLWFQFNEAGKIVFTEEYRNDLLNGKKTVYYPPNKETGKVDRIASITHFTDGKADGEYVEYFDFGSPRVKGQFKNGLKSGVWTEYQPTGKPLVMNRFKGGVKHGWCSAYDALGKESNKVYYYYGQPKDGKDLEFIMKQMKEKGINPNE